MPIIILSTSTVVWSQNNYHTSSGQEQWPLSTKFWSLKPWVTIMLRSREWVWSPWPWPPNLIRPERKAIKTLGTNTPPQIVKHLLFQFVCRNPVKRAKAKQKWIIRKHQLFIWHVKIQLSWILVKYTFYLSKYELYLKQLSFSNITSKRDDSLRLKYPVQEINKDSTISTAPTVRTTYII